MQEYKALISEEGLKLFRETPRVCFGQNVAEAMEDLRVKLEGAYDKVVVDGDELIAYDYSNMTYDLWKVKNW